MAESTSSKSSPDMNKQVALQNALYDSPNPAVAGKGYADVQVTFSATPDAQTTLTHNLGWIPTRYMVVSQDRASDVYVSGGTGATAWSTTAIYLKANVASVVAIVRVW
jgi:hypothetical protein